jgi:hypothetical protein
MTDVISITRRGLMIGGSAVAGAVAATSSAKPALAQGGPTERLAYVGCYTPPGEGIVLYRVNADTGAMTQVKVFSGISNPSWIALDPLHRVLYAVNEDEPSCGVSAFTVNHASGDLKLINKVDSHGKWPQLHQEVRANCPRFPAHTIPRLFSALARKLMVCREQVFDVAIAEREAHIKPNGMPDDRGGNWWRANEIVMRHLSR